MRGKALEGPADHGRRHRRRAVGDRLQAAEITSAQLRVIDEAGHHRRHEEGVGDPLGLDERQPVGGVELREQHHRAPAVEGAEQRGDAGDVVQRRGEQHAAVVLTVGRLGAAHDVVGERAVGEHHALGQRGGAARVEQHGQVAVVDVGDVRQLVGAAAQRRPLAVEGDDVLQRRRAGLLDEVGVPAVDEHHAGARVGEQVGDLALLGAVVHRDGDGTHRGDGEQRLHGGQAVGGEEADPVTCRPRRATAGRRHPGRPRHGGRRTTRRASPTSAGALGRDERGDVDEHGEVHVWKNVTRSCIVDGSCARLSTAGDAGRRIAT